MRTTIGLFACLVLGGLTPACVDEPPGSGESGSAGRLSATLSAGSAHDVSAVRFRIVSAAQTCTDTPLLERTVPFRPELRSGDIDSPDASGTHPFANALLVLEEGDYRICAQPLQTDSTPSADCGPAETTANVFPKVTTEVTLIAQCKGDAKGAIGITTILNDPPHIDDLTIEPSYLTSCDKARLTVTATDPNGDALAYTWQLTRGDGLLSPSQNIATFEPAAAGDYEVHISVRDTHEATTSLTIPLHVSPGACGEDAGTDADTGQQDAAVDGDAGGDAPADGGQIPERLLTYLIEGAGAADDLWAVAINNGTPGTPIRVNAPLAPGQDISWTGWGGDGSHLAYRTGTDDLFIVDMTGPAPGAPRVLANVPSFSWSPNGRYLARVEQNPTTFAFKVAVVDLNDPGLVWRYTPNESHEDLRNFSWSADSGWVFGLTPTMFLWNVRVTGGGPETILGEPATLIEPVAFWPSPVGAEYAVLLHYGLSGGKYAVGSGNPSGYRAVTDPWVGFPPEVHTEFVGFLPNGDIAYWGQPPGVDLSTVCDSSSTCRIHVVNNCGHLRVFAVTATPQDYLGLAWRAAPDGRSIAVSGMLRDPAAVFGSRSAVHLWKRNAATCWTPPIEVAFAPPLEGSYDVELNTTADWAPDSRTVLVRHSLHAPWYAVIDTQGAPPFSPTEVAFPDSASGIRWAQSSLRLFYDVTAPNALGYIDLRAGTPTIPTTVNPAFAHSAGDTIDWALSSGDPYVAMRGDFLQDGRHELYIADLRGVTPSAPVRVHAPLGEAQVVSSFAWQPALRSP
jgi:hypothetical protein